MNCPVDGATLLMSERQGVEIDYCPQCRGVWLDRGELDKLIERSDDDGGGWRDEHRDRERDRDWERDRGQGWDRRPPKKKKWLSEMFDFD